MAAVLSWWMYIKDVMRMLLRVLSIGWAQKMVAAKQWSFELFYWDLTVGLFLTALLGAVTLGSMGSEGSTSHYRNRFLVFSFVW